MKTLNTIVSAITMTAFVGISAICLHRGDYLASYLAFAAFFFCLTTFLTERKNAKTVSAYEEISENQYKVNSSILEFTEDTIGQYNELRNSVDRLYTELKRVDPENGVADEVFENLTVSKYEKYEEDA